MAYSISRKLPSVSIKGKVANEPNRPGWSRPIWAANSLDSRAKRRSVSAWLKKAPGCIKATTEVAMPFWSMLSSDICADHLGAPPPPKRAKSAAYLGGTMWWWISMRCGLLAWADVGLWQALSAAPRPTAVKPDKKPRRDD